MTHIELKIGRKVKENLENFERFLRAYDLKVIFRQEHAVTATITLSINARCYEQARWVSGLAFDFFEDGLLSMRTEFETVAVKRAA